jgi:hypothetical protein
MRMKQKIDFYNNKKYDILIILVDFLSSVSGFFATQFRIHVPWSGSVSGQTKWIRYSDGMVNKEVSKTGEQCFWFYESTLYP